MKRSRRLPALADTLGVLLPDAVETETLRAALGIGNIAAWADRLGTPLASGAIFKEKPALRRLYPMLGLALGPESATADPRLMAMLRAGLLWEEKRAVRIEEIVATVLSALGRGSVRAVVLKGVALATTIYPKPSLRHCHDIDLLIRPADRDRAIGLLATAGFVPSIEQPSVSTGTVALVHHDGLPLQLHTRLLPDPHWRLPLDAMLARCETIDIAGESARILAPADTLLHLCALVGQGAATSPSWVVDAALILRACPPTPEAWDTFADAAAASRLALPILVILEYLQSAVGASVPGAVLDRLARSRRFTWTERDAILTAMRRRPAVRLTDMVARSSWRSRLAVLRWKILPSPPHLKAWCAERGLRWTPAWYIVRPFRRLGIRTGVLRTPARPAAS